jgi:A/G-specific adenine glycosylase
MLAAADEGEVLRAVGGAWLYARARNLHACARAVAAAGGGFRNREGLRALPGIGAVHGARRWAAIAFGANEIPVDGNVERVTARLFAIEAELPAARPAIAGGGGGLKGNGERPGDFAQALLDLGATICTPTSPACALCPWIGGCAARRGGIAGHAAAQGGEEGAADAAWGGVRADRRRTGGCCCGGGAAKGLLGG